MFNRRTGSLPIKEALVQLFGRQECQTPERGVPVVLAWQLLNKQERIRMKYV